jgi:flagellar biosynthesis chaperone FliJ
VALAGVLGGYAVHEHNAAQALAARNQQAAVSLKEQRAELTDLTSKVNVLVAREQAAQQAAQARAEAAHKPRTGVSGGRHVESRWQKMQSQIDAQNKAIAQTQNELAATQGDLNNTRTELTGSIAHTHDELVLLEKRGQKNYTEFDIVKSREFQREGPFSVKLRKANVKHQYADLDLIVDDRTLTQKHVNLYQPVMFSTPDSPQPVQVVINKIDKNHIHGYIAAPRYRQSELASAGNGAQQTGAQDPDGGAVQVAEPTLQTRPRH